ncbi:MAG: cytochrome c oxidase subunit 3 family protein [Gammaproteobacteria bacterium]|nr:cytochrome c oxidase subunit 3 family protein [Gammaproteobacteria bacterium]
MSSEATISSRQLPGDFAIWLFIYAELLVFGVFFISYAVVRSHHVELFNESQLLLDTRLGLINTLVLITSSYFVVRAVHAIQNNNQSRCVVWLNWAIASGLIFVVVKIYEFYSKAAEGINLSTNVFYMYYLSMTFFHFMHVILGLVILTAVMLKARQGGYSREDHIGVETGASYWHMVDLVWIVLFPMVYLMR